MHQTDSKKMNDERGITIVKGYHRVSPPHPTAVAHGLKWRVAWILDSYRSDKIDMYFDAEIFCGLMENLERFLEAERTEVYMEDSRTPCTIAAMREAIFSLPEGDQYPPEYIVFHKQGAVNCVVMIEDWAHVGGPDPYNDSYTAAIFTGDDVSGQLEEIASKTCQEFGVPVLKVIQASPVLLTRKVVITQFFRKLWKGF